jgi:signal transduction histidine kinase
MTIEQARCDLTAVAQDVKRLLARQARHAGVDLEIIGAGMVQADPRRLRQMLLNLVLNAIQALHGSSAEDALVTIDLRGDGLQVIDNGPGVPVERSQDLFQAFASSRPEGTGLGLHLAHLIAEAHGASLSYEAVSPHGSCFILRGLKTELIEA